MTDHRYPANGPTTRPNTYETTWGGFISSRYCSGVKRVGIGSTAEEAETELVAACARFEQALLQDRSYDG